MKCFTYALLSTLSISSFGFGIGSYKPTLMDQLIVNHQIKEKLLGNDKKGRKKVDPNQLCSDYFERGKVTWAKNLKAEGEALQVQGFMDRKFSIDEILNMKPKHRFITSSIRGQDKVVSKSSYGSAAIFPHSYPYCENFFQEEVTVVKIEDHTCRQIKLVAPKAKGMEYYQVFCEDDSNIYISYAPIKNVKFIKKVENEEDCVSCN